MYWNSCTKGAAYVHLYPAGIGNLRRRTARSCVFTSVPGAHAGYAWVHYCCDFARILLREAASRVITGLMQHLGIMMPNDQLVTDSTTDVVKHEHASHNSKMCSFATH
jgi:hypothetical protein